MKTESRTTGTLIFAIAFVVALGAAPMHAQTPSTPAPAASSRPTPPAAGAALTGAVGETQTGLGAYYNRRLEGRRTASGERFDNRALTTAH